MAVVRKFFHTNLPRLSPCRHKQKCNKVVAYFRRSGYVLEQWLTEKRLDRESSDSWLVASSLLHKRLTSNAATCGLTLPYLMCVGKSQPMTSN